MRAAGRYNRSADAGGERVIARRVVATGQVQGVGFRWFTAEAAAREGVTGWVRNLADGRVEAWVEGEREAVLRVELAMRRGPSRARVEIVRVSEEEPSGAFATFSVT
jgi:acylphosphatase